MSATKKTAMCPVCWIRYTKGTFTNHVQGPTHRHAVEFKRAQKAK